ncbi:MAG: Peroxiredoxin [Chloroflexi bacterium]|nr:MAG: Peroxiredoxin [Chloroflexota bacterium]
MEIGSPAFDFEIPDQHGHIHKLSDYAGKANVLLSFHVYSFTGGCTNQMIGFRAAYPEFKELNTKVLGISCDAQPTQAAYSTSLGNLPYPVLSDFHPKGQVSKEYDIYNEERGASNRGIFIMDINGIIQYIEIYPRAEDISIDHLLQVIKNLS